MYIYAVKVLGGDWRIATRANGADYSLGNPSWDVWSEQDSTAFIGYVGNGEKVVLLEGPES